MRKSKLYGLEDEVKKLYLAGKTCKEVAESIYLRYGIKVSEETIRNLLIKLNIKRRRRGVRVKYPPHFGKLTPCKAYILGVLMGDGCLEKRVKKKNSHVYQIWLKTIDLDFARAFKQCCEKLYGKKLKIKEKMLKTNFTEKPRKFYIVVATGKAIVEDLLCFVENEKMFKYNGWRVPEKIFKSNEECKIMFLRGFSDSEGSVSSNGRIVSIRLDSKNMKGLNDIKKLLEMLGIHSVIVKVNEVNVYGCLIYRKLSTIKFASKIGFYNSRKKSKLYTLIRQVYGVEITPPALPR